MTRLLDYARRATAHRNPADRVATFADIGVRLDESSAVMTNWKARGISRDGALEAQRRFGCNAWWLLTGEGPQSVSDWPFAMVDRSRWDACTDQERGYVQHALHKALEAVETARSTGQAPAITTNDGREYVTVDFSWLDFVIRDLISGIHPKGHEPMRADALSRLGLPPDRVPRYRFPLLEPGEDDPQPAKKRKKVR